MHSPRVISRATVRSAGAQHAGALAWTDAHLSMTDGVEAVFQVHCERKAAIAGAALWVHSPDKWRRVVPIREVVLTATDTDIEIHSCACGIEPVPSVLRTSAHKISRKMRFTHFCCCDLPH